MVNLKKILCFLCATFILSCLSSQELVAQKRSKKRAKTVINPDEQLKTRLINHVSLLAHDSLEGRRTGTLGEEKAFRYIAAQYREMGIGSFYNNYLQSFTIDEGKKFDHQSNLQVNEVTLSPFIDYFPLTWSGVGVLETQSVVALNEAGEGWWIDLDPILQKNKENPHFIIQNHLLELAKDAASKGAKGIIFYNSGLLDDLMAYLPKDRTEPLAIPVIYIKPTAIKRLQITSDAAPKVVAKIQFEKAERTARNLIANIDNKAPYTIVLGAHYDHLGYGEDKNSRHDGEPAIHNGADDNASGTAAVLELARIIRQKADIRFNYVFAHFSGEELGLYGSKYFTENPPVDLKTVNYMVNLDMVGRLNDSSKSLTVGGVGTSASWATLLPQNPGFSIKYDSSGTGPSDHASFYRKDIPVLFLFTGLHTDYHRPSDDAELINYKGMVDIVRYIEKIVEATPGQSKLAFTKTREQSMGTGRFKVSIGIMPDYTFSGTGVKADGVIDGRPAKKAGLQANDIILQLGEHLITGVDTYMQALNRFDKGQTTTIVFKRGDTIMEKEITF